MSLYINNSIQSAKDNPEVQAILAGNYEPPVVAEIEYGRISKDTRQKIYALLALGYSARVISGLAPDMPNYKTINDWMRAPKLADEAGLIEKMMIDEVYARFVTYTDANNYNDVLETSKGALSHNAGVAAMKSAADACKWLLERRDPLRFAEASMRPITFKFNKAQDTVEQINAVIEGASRGEMSVNDANRIIDMIAKKLEIAEIPKIIEMVRRHETLLTMQNSEQNSARFKINLSSTEHKTQ